MVPKTMRTTMLITLLCTLPFTNSFATISLFSPKQITLSNIALTMAIGDPNDDFFGTYSRAGKTSHEGHPKFGSDYMTSAGGYRGGPPSRRNDTMGYNDRNDTMGYTSGGERDRPIPTPEQREYFEGIRQEGGSRYPPPQDDDMYHREDLLGRSSRENRGYEPPSHHERIDNIRNEWQQQKGNIEKNHRAGRWNDNLDSGRRPDYQADDVFPSHHEKLARAEAAEMMHRDNAFMGDARQQDHPIVSNNVHLPSHHEIMKTIHTEPERREEFFDSRQRKYQKREAYDLPDYRDTIEKHRPEMDMTRPKPFEAPGLDRSRPLRNERVNYRDESEPFYDDFGPKPDRFRPERNYRDESEPFFDSGPRPEKFRPNLRDETEPFFDNHPRPDISRPSGRDETEPFFESPRPIPDISRPSGRDETEPFFESPRPIPDISRPSGRDETEPYFESPPVRIPKFRPNLRDEAEPYFDHRPRPDLARPSGRDETEPYFESPRPISDLARPSGRDEAEPFFDDIGPRRDRPYFDRDDGFRPLNVFETGYFDIGKGPPVSVFGGEIPHSREIIRPIPSSDQIAYFEEGEGRDFLLHDDPLLFDDDPLLDGPRPSRRRRHLPDDPDLPPLSTVRDFSRYSTRDDHDVPYTLPDYHDKIDIIHEESEKTRRDFYNNDANTRSRRRYRDSNEDPFLGSRGRRP